jgi:hypothetical protein
LAGRNFSPAGAAHAGTETPNVFVGFADDRRLVGLVFVLFVFDLVIIVVVGISR